MLAGLDKNSWRPDQIWRLQENADSVNTQWLNNLHYPTLSLIIFPIANNWNMLYSIFSEDKHLYKQCVGCEAG